MKRAAFAACLAALLVVCPSAAAKSVWLCKPGLAKNPCLAPLTTTVIDADGPAGVERTRREFLREARFTAGRDEYLPIPQQQIDFSQGLYQQNPGY
jgi:hypothetical protein